MGPLAIFLLGGGAALVGQDQVKKGLKRALRTAIKARVDLERTVASIREDLEDLTAEVRDEDKARGEPSAKPDLKA